MPDVSLPPRPAGQSLNPPPQTLASAGHSRFATRAFLLDTVLSALVPLLLYRATRHYLHASELSALLYASLYTVGQSLFDLRKHRQLNPVSIMVALGILTSVIALFLGGGPRILLLRESLLTAIFGVACFFSLLLPRPLMFYFGRYFIAGADPEKVACFNQGWAYPAVRRMHRTITTVWGATLLGEFGLRVWMIVYLSTATVLSAAPILFNGITLLTFLWTMRYAKVAKKGTGGATPQAAAELSPSPALAIAG